MYVQRTRIMGRVREREKKDCGAREQETKSKDLVSVRTESVEPIVFIGLGSGHGGLPGSGADRQNRSGKGHAV